MPWYNDLRPQKDPNKQKYSLTFSDFSKREKIRTIDNLLILRKRLAESIEAKKTDKNLLLCSWNIKEFGHLKKRLPESYFYIAEIISKFDLVAIQEIKSGLKDLRVLMKLLGKNWKYLINDITEGRDGNSERFAYLYDTRRVNFTGLAGEISIWKELLEENTNVTELKRTPYITGFKAGWKSFALLNVHLQPNDDSESQTFRKKEVELLTKAILEKKKRHSLWTENIVVLGDFNLYDKDKDIVKVFNDAGFIESDLLKDVRTNTAIKQSTFDRMFFMHNEYFKTPSKATGERGGVIEIFDIVFEEENFRSYEAKMRKHKGNPSTLTDDEKLRKYFRNNWRKTQLSDHKPIWIELNIDSSDDFLVEKKAALKN